MFIPFILIAIVLYIVKGNGEIRKWDYIVDYNNANYAKKFGFGFSLQSGLSKSDYLKITFPFKLHTTLTGNVPNDMVVYVFSLSSKDCKTLAKFKTNIFFLSADSETFNYYIQVLDELGQSPKELIPESFYMLELDSITPEFQYPKHYIPVKLASVSDVSLNAIYYDYNNNFANIELVAAPKNTLGLSSTITSTEKLVPDAKYDISMEIKTTVSYNKTGIRFRLIQVIKDFKFNSYSCTSFAKNVTKTVNGTAKTVLEPALDLSNFTCEISSATGEGTITMKIPVTNETTYRFFITIKNPKFVINGGGLEVRMLLPFTNTIIERNTESNIFSTGQLNWGTSNANLKVKLGWGVDPFQTNAPPEFKILRTVNGGALPYYNSLKFEFLPNLPTPPSLKIKIELDLSEAAGFTVLTGSISENLPQYENKVPVKCVLDASSPTNQKIICQEVGVLSQNGLYHIAFKAKFPYDAGEADVAPNFGKISVYSWNPDKKAYDSNLLINPEKFSGSLKTKNNFDWISNLEANGFGAVHSQEDATITAISASNYGVKYKPGTNQRIVFVINGAHAPFGSTGAIGMTLYASMNIIKNKINIAPPATYKAADSLTTTTLRGRATEDSGDSKKWTKIEIWATSLFNFQLGMVNSGSTRTFGLSDFEVVNQAGPYPDDYCFDIYGGGYDNYEGTPTFKVNFAFNAYTISSTAVGNNANTGNIKMSIVNFWTGTSGNGNLDGSKFPAFLRITGYLPASDLALVKKISVFFDYVDFFSDPTNTDQVSCSTTFPSAICHGFNGEFGRFNNIFNMKRVDVSVGSFIARTGESSNFHALIPVSSVENQAVLKVFLITSMSHPLYGDIKPYMKVFQTIQNIFIVTKSATAGAMTSDAAVLSQNYKINYALGPQPIVGTTANPTAAVINTGHNDASNKIRFNSATEIGSGFFFQGIWEMIADGFFVSGNWVTNQLVSEKCLPYSYYKTNYKYGFFCPYSTTNAIGMASSISCLNFVFSSREGRKLPQGTFGGWSDKLGVLVSYQEQSTSATDLIAGKISFLEGGMQPLLTRNTKNNRIYFYFETQNEIDINGKVHMKFSGSTWPFNPLNTAKCQLVADVGSNNRAHTCSIIVSQNTDLIFDFNAVGGATNFPAGKYKLYEYSIDVANVVLTDVKFTATTFTSASIMIDESSALTGNFGFSTQTPVITLVLSNLIISSSTKENIGPIEFDMVLSEREIWSMEHFSISLGSFSLNNSDAKACPCTVLDLNTKNSSTLFKSKIQSGMNYLQLYPKEDVLSKFTSLRIKCDNVINPYVNTSGIKAQLFFGSIEIVSSNTLALPLFDNFTVIQNATFKKLMNFPGSTTIIEINYTLGNLTIGNMTSFLLSLPPYYTPKQKFECRVDTTDVFCRYHAPNLIIIQGFEKNITSEKNSSVILSIQGILQPDLSAVTLGKFFFAVYDNLNPNKLLGQKYFDDIKTHTSSPSTIFLKEFAISNTYIRENTSISFHFEIGADIPVGNKVLVNFMDTSLFGILLTWSNPANCSFLEIDEASNKTRVLSDKCSYFGLQVEFDVTEILSKNFTFMIQINHFLNPERFSCSPLKWVISIVNSARDTVLYRSCPTNGNYQSLTFVKNTNLHYAYFYNVSNSRGFTHHVDTVTIRAGIISDPIILRNEKNPFDNELGYYLIEKKNMIFRVSSGNISIGDRDVLLYLSTPSSTFPKVYEMVVQKLELPVQMYSSFVMTSVNVIWEKFEIKTAYNLYHTCSGGISMPIVIDLSNNVPEKYINMTAELKIVGGNILNLKFNSTNTSKTNFTLNKGDYYEILRVKGDQNLAVGAISQIVLSIEGANKDSYKLGTEIIAVKIADRPSAIPVLQINQDQPSTLSDRAGILINVTEISSILCAVTVRGGPVRSYLYTKAKYESKYKYNFSDYMHEQFLTFNVEYPHKQNHHFLIYNLRAKKSYDLHCWAVTLLGNISNLVSTNISTKENGSKLMKLGITVEATLTKFEEERISCILCKKFAYPCSL